MNSGKGGEKRKEKEENTHTHTYSLNFSPLLPLPLLPLPLLPLPGEYNAAGYDLQLNFPTLDRRWIFTSMQKQRMGRVGRTCNGFYYQLFSDDRIKGEFPPPKILQDNPVVHEFNMRLQGRYSLFQLPLPTSFPDDSKRFAQSQLERLRLLQNSQPTERLRLMKLLPVVGDFRMYVTVMEGFEFGCGDDVLRMAAVLKGMPNVSSALLRILHKFKAEQDGDLLTMLNVFDELVRFANGQRQAVGMGVGPAGAAGAAAGAGAVLVTKAQQNDRVRRIVHAFCQQQGLAVDKVGHFFRRWLLTYEKFQESFTKLSQMSADQIAFLCPNVAKPAVDRLYAQSQRKANPNQRWELLCKSLLEGFRNNVFISMTKLGGRTGDYALVSSSRLSQDRQTVKQTLAVLDFGSAMYKKMTQQSEQVPLIFAWSMIYPPRPNASLAAPHPDADLGFVPDKLMLSLAGRVDMAWLTTPLHRYVQFDRQTAPQRIPAGEGTFDKGCVVLEQELRAFQAASAGQTEVKIFKDGKTGNDKVQYDSKVDKLMKMPSVFHQMIRRWNNEYQVAVNLDQASRTLTVQGGLPSVKAQIQEEVQALESAVSQAGTLHTPTFEVSDEGHQNAGISFGLSGLSGFGVPPARIPFRAVQDQEKMTQILARLARVTDLKRSTSDIWKYVHSKDASRETRMEVVGLIALRHGCRLEGGFVRDWIINGEQGRPDTAGTPGSWLKVPGQPRGGRDGRPETDDKLIPHDLDIQVPMKSVSGWFDIESFIRDVQLAGIEVSMVHKDQYLRAILFDGQIDPRPDAQFPTGRFGPFTAEFIEPQFVSTHDMLDFDVNNLCCLADNTRELAMRIPHPKLTLTSTVENILKKHFICTKLRAGNIPERIAKMEGRGWKLLREDVFVPYADPVNKARDVTMVRVPATDPIFQTLKTEIERIQGTIVRIDRISNFSQDILYEANKTAISAECHGDPNERFLYHGEFFFLFFFFLGMCMVLIVFCCLFLKKLLLLSYGAE